MNKFKWILSGLLALAVGKMLWGVWFILVPMELALAGICLASPMANFINRKQVKKEQALQAAADDASKP